MESMTRVYLLIIGVLCSIGIVHAGAPPTLHEAIRLYTTILSRTAETFANVALSATDVLRKNGMDDLIVQFDINVYHDARSYPDPAMTPSKYFMARSGMIRHMLQDISKDDPFRIPSDPSQALEAMSVFVARAQNIHDMLLMDSNYCQEMVRLGSGRFKTWIDRCIDLHEHIFQIIDLGKYYSVRLDLSNGNFRKIIHSLLEHSTLVDHEGLFLKKKVLSYAGFQKDDIYFPSGFFIEQVHNGHDYYYTRDHEYMIKYFQHADRTPAYSGDAGSNTMPSLAEETVVCNEQQLVYHRQPWHMMDVMFSKHAFKDLAKHLVDNNLLSIALTAPSMFDKLYQGIAMVAFGSLDCAERVSHIVLAKLPGLPQKPKPYLSIESIIHAFVHATQYDVAFVVGSESTYRFYHVPGAHSDRGVIVFRVLDHDRLHVYV